MQIGMATEQRFIRAIDDPSDTRVGKAPAEGGQDRQRMNDVTQRARFNKADASSGILV
jgi:hypothetical protein